VSKPTTVALVTLGCARNDVDSEELAGRLAADGWTLVEDPASADIALVTAPCVQSSPLGVWQSGTAKS
jgi:tRNA A37 methylthiotransferase MiaB